jgi:hypothetical protein
MNMVGHERIRVDVETVLEDRLSRYRKENFIVSRGSKDVRAIVPALNQVLSQSGNEQTWAPRHIRRGGKVYACPKGAGFLAFPAKYAPMSVEFAAPQPVAGGNFVNLGVRPRSDPPPTPF